MGAESIGGFYGGNLEENGIFDYLPKELVGVMKKEGYTEACQFNEECIDFTVNQNEASLLAQPNQDMTNVPSQNGAKQKL